MSTREAGRLVDGDSDGNRKPKKLTNKDKAAMGANRIGIWTRHRVICPHDPDTRSDHCLWGDDFKHDILSVVKKFKKCRHHGVLFSSFLVTDLVPTVLEC